MNRKLWMTAALILVVGSLLSYFTNSDSGYSDDELAQLLEKEQQRERVTIRQQVADEAVAQDNGESERHQEVTIRPAIVELPEYTWDATRAWNLPLNNPPIAKASEAFFLNPDDYVLGVLLGRRARAYPWFVMANYHAVNDQIGSKPVIVTLCEACNGGAAFLATTEHTTIDFRPCGIKNGTWYAVDFQTGSYWYPFIGEAFDGPLKGTRLERLRAYFCTWRQWASEHPETTVVLANEEVRDRPHGKMGHMANDQTFNPELLARLATSPRNPKLDLFPAAELVFGLIPQADSEARAYSLAHLRRASAPVQTRIGDVPVLLLIQNQYQVGAYIRRLGDKELHLEVAAENPLMLRDQFGNQWNTWGRKVSGPDYQAELPVADGYLTKWYEWLENYPTTELIADRLP